MVYDAELDSSRQVSSGSPIGWINLNGCIASPPVEL